MLYDDALLKPVRVAQQAHDAGIFLKLAAFEPVEQCFTTLYIKYYIKQ